MGKTIYSKENGVVSIVHEKGGVNPCAECANGYASKCPKVFDETKKNIGDYDFITDGEQVYNEKGELESFVVTKCTHFVKEEPKKKPTTQEEILRINRARESIFLYYFNGADLDEASKNRDDLFRRGTITHR